MNAPAPHLDKIISMPVSTDILRFALSKATDPEVAANLVAALPDEEALALNTTLPPAFVWSQRTASAKRLAYLVTYCADPATLIRLTLRATTQRTVLYRIAGSHYMTDELYALLADVAQASGDHKLQKALVRPFRRHLNDVLARLENAEQIPDLLAALSRLFSHPDFDPSVDAIAIAEAVHSGRHHGVAELLLDVSHRDPALPVLAEPIRKHLFNLYLEDLTSSESPPISANTLLRDVPLEADPINRLVAAEPYIYLESMIYRVTNRTELRVVLDALHSRSALSLYDALTPLFFGSDDPLFQTYLTRLSDYALVEYLLNTTHLLGSTNPRGVALEYALELLIDRCGDRRTYWMGNMANGLDALAATDLTSARRIATAVPGLIPYLVTASSTLLFDLLAEASSGRLELALSAIEDHPDAPLGQLCDTIRRLVAIDGSTATRARAR